MSVKAVRLRIEDVDAPKLAVHKKRVPYIWTESSLLNPSGTFCKKLFLASRRNHECEKG